jgi:hypothetical protein
MIWERCQEISENWNIPIQLNSDVVGVERGERLIKSTTVKYSDRADQINGEYFVSSMPITLLMIRLDPLPPDHVLEAAQGLKYRDFLIVSLIVNREHLFTDNWIYIY